MTVPPNSAPTDQDQPDDNSLSWRASYPMSSTPVGSATHGVPAPGEAGPGRHQGALTREDAAEGGPHTQEETHSCHNPLCVHRAPEKPSVRNRLRKPAADKRVHMIASRFNDSEKQSLLDAASASAMTVSGFLAHASLAAARDLSRTAAAVAGEREMLNELFALRRRPRPDRQQRQPGGQGLELRRGRTPCGGRARGRTQGGRARRRLHPPPRRVGGLRTVIPRVHKRGTRTIGLLYYLYGPGTHEEHIDPHLVAAWDSLAPDPGRDPEATHQALQQLLDLPVDSVAPSRLTG